MGAPDRCRSGLPHSFRVAPIGHERGPGRQRFGEYNLPPSRQTRDPYFSTIGEILIDTDTLSPARACTPLVRMAELGAGHISTSARRRQHAVGTQPGAVVQVLLTRCKARHLLHHQCSPDDVQFGAPIAGPGSTELGTLSSETGSRHPAAAARFRLSYHERCGIGPPPTYVESPSNAGQVAIHSVGTGRPGSIQ